MPGSVNFAQDHEMNAIYNQSVELRKEQEELASDYEEKSSYEMAYLSRWYVLEKILKLLDAERRKKQLYREICEWKEYLENSCSNQPKPITNYLFNLKEAKTIPDVEKIKDYLDCELRIIKEIMNTQGRWRRRRNDIAHRAVSFGRKETYEEYRNKIKEGISEIGQALTDKCN